MKILLIILLFAIPAFAEPNDPCETVAQQCLKIKAAQDARIEKMKAEQEKIKPIVNLVVIKEEIVPDTNDPNDNHMQKHKKAMIKIRDNKKLTKEEKRAAIKEIQKAERAERDKLRPKKHREKVVK